MFSFEFFTHGYCTIFDLFFQILFNYSAMLVINANKIITKTIIIKNGIKKSETHTRTKNKQNHNRTPTKLRLNDFRT